MASSTRFVDFVILLCTYQGNFIRLEVHQGLAVIINLFFTNLNSLPGPFPIFLLMCEAPHVEVCLNNFRSEYVISLITTQTYCLMRSLKSKCLWADTSSYR